MPRRSSFSRRLSLEALEIRCNPSSFDLMAGAFAETAADVPAQVAAPGNRIWEYTPCCDPTAQTGANYFNGRFLRGDDLTREQAVVDQQALPKPPAYSLVIDPRASDAGTDSGASNTGAYFTNDYSLTVGDSSGANLNAFAGQTIRIRFEAADASTASQPVGGDGHDLLLGGDARDTLERSSAGTHELGHTLGFRHEHTVPTTTSDGSVRFIKDSIATGVWAADDSATVSGRIAAVVVDPSDPVGGVYNHPDLYKNIWINQSELESVIDSLARDVASHCGSRSSGELASFLAFPGFTGGVSVAAGDVNGDKIDDIIIAAGPGAGPHVK